MMHTVGMMGGTWGTAGGLLSLAFWVGIVLIALWFYRWVKDSAENKRFLAWGLGLTIGVAILASLTLWGVGMMGNRLGFSGGMMGAVMQQMMDDPEFQDEMHKMMDEVIENHDKHHPNAITN